MLRTLLLLGGTALLVLLLWRLGPAEILAALSRIGWYFVPVVLLGGAHHATRALALHVSVLRPGRLRYRDALAIRLSGEAIQSLTFTGPVLSQPAKAWLLESHGLTLEEGYAAAITEYLICAFVTVGMSAGGLLFLLVRFDPPPAVAGALLVLVCVFGAFLIASAAAIARRFYAIGTLMKGLARLGILRGRLQPDIARVNRMEDLLLIVLRDSPRRFGTIVLIECAAQALLVFELFWLLRAMDLMVPASYPLVIESSAKAIGIAFLFVPLQLGVSEGAYAVIFSVMGLSAAAGFALAFIRRARVLAIAGVGLATLAVLTRRRLHGATRT